MKRGIFCICLIVGISAGDLFAQMTKKEKAAWKAKAKEYVKAPDQLKQLVDDKTAAEEKAVNLAGENNSMKAAAAGKDDKISELEEQLSRMRVDLAATKAELEKYKSGMISTADTKAAGRTAQPVKNDVISGLVFKVQVGAFTNKDLSKYFDNNPNFGGEVGKESTEPQRINIGVFRNYWEADTFKKYMREMGVKDAWIVPYRDGKRIEIKDVLDQIVTENPTK
ncbi:MAG: Ezrin/radixin/moesin family protein [Bacteroidetes bacterium]|nr:Ezrin/radixin/moesin family protein [Bacteroidota bacterium]